MEPMENTIRIIRSVERTHKNLGLPVVFAKLIDLADMGLLIVGERGRGKGAILDTIKQLRHRDVLEIARLTPAGLAKVAEKLEGKSYTVVNPDLSSLHNPYLKEAAINTLAHLLFDRRMPQSWTGMYSFSIQHCVISFIGAVQPRLLRELNKLNDWESMYKDRFLRLYLFYPFGTPEYRKDSPRVEPILIPQSSVDNVQIPAEIRTMDGYNRLKDAIKFQTSEGRCGMFADKLLQASAFLNCRDVVLKDDVYFLELFVPYLALEYWLSERETISEPFKLNANSYIMLFYLIENVEATRKQMMRHFSVSRATVMRALEPLKERNIVCGVYGEDVYHLNPEWHKRYIQPIIDFGRSIGVC